MKLQVSLSEVKPKNQPFVGSVIKGGRFGEIVILSQKYGRKFIEYKWAQVADHTKTGWLKIPMGRDPFISWPFIRKAKPAEMKGGTAAVQNVQKKKAERKYEAQDHLQNKQLKAGDVVRVAYTNGPAYEALLDIEPGAGKVALVRQSSGAASSYTKRRLINAKFCEKVADGGGSFDPNNPIYAKYHIHIPEFYKQGGKVAKRAPRGFW